MEQREFACTTDLIINLRSQNSSNARTSIGHFSLNLHRLKHKLYKTKVKK
jgi:hypothetical protein